MKAQRVSNFFPAPRLTGGVLLAWLAFCPMPARADITNCQRNYDAATQRENADYSRTWDSIERNGKLNRMNVSSELLNLKSQHIRDLRTLKNIYDECVEEANRQEKARLDAERERLDAERKAAQARL